MKKIWIPLVVTAIAVTLGKGTWAKNSSSPQGGSFQVALDREPENLSPLVAKDFFSGQVHKFLLDSLLWRDLDTLEWKPALAEKFEVSKDGLSYTFYLRKSARFHDGTKVTAEDVKFSFEVVQDPKFKATHRRPDYESIQKIEVLDPSTVRFVLKEKSFSTFNVIAGQDSYILPRSIYNNPDRQEKRILGTGPYLWKSYERGNKLILERNPHWWGNELKEFQGLYNFEKIVFRFVKDKNLQIEMLKKGELDFIQNIRPEDFVNKLTGKEWGKSLIKKKVESQAPKYYTFIGWNLRRDLFKDQRVRKALALLMNRPLMIEKFGFGMLLPATGPWYLQSPYADPNVKPLPFDPEQARSLLEKSGWKDSDRDGILDKVINGKKQDLEFVLLNPNQESEKYFTIYKEDLKRAGIRLNIRLVDWTTFVKSMDEHSFDAIALAWQAADVDNDPKSIWHSQSSEKGGSNFVGYSNKTVDKLLEEGRTILDSRRRIPLWREVYRRIAEDQPYLFMLVPKYELYAHTARVKMKKASLKYALGYEYWWMEKP